LIVEGDPGIGADLKPTPIGVWSHHRGSFHGQVGCPRATEPAERKNRSDPQSEIPIHKITSTKEFNISARFRISVALSIYLMAEGLFFAEVWRSRQGMGEFTGLRYRQCAPVNRAVTRPLNDRVAA
jgi:hypothetical protein